MSLFDLCFKKPWRHLVWAIPLCGLLALGPIGNSALVGDLADPAQWVIDGAAPFSVDDVRQSLISDFDVASVATPNERFVPFSTLISQKVRAGFQHDGFPHPIVSVDRTADGRLGIHIEPGSRFDRGDIRVTGHGVSLAEQLHSLLVTKQNNAVFTGVFKLDSADLVKCDLDQSEDSIPWAVGESASFDDQYLKGLHISIQNALAKLGYFSPKFELTVDPTESKATLEINIADLGAPAILDEIVTDGSTKNAVDEIIVLTELKTNEPFNLAKMQAAQKRLWESGRFQRHVLSLSQNAKLPGHFVLYLELTDSTDAPLLAESLSPGEQAMLNIRHWLLGALQGGNAVAARFPQDLGQYHFDWQACVGEGGFGVRAKFSPIDQSHETSQQAGIIISPKSFGVYLPTFRSKYVLSGAAHSLQVQMNVAPTTEEKQRSAFNISAAITSATTQPSRTFVMNLAPVSFVAAAKNPKFSFDPAAAQVSWSIDGRKTKFDASSGALLADHSPTTSGSAAPVLEMNDGELSHFVDDLDSDTATVNACDAAKPVATFCTFLSVNCASLRMVSWHVEPAARDRAAAIVGKLLSPDVFDAWGFDTKSAGEEHFWIPPNLNAAQVNSMLGQFGKLILPVCGKIFSFGTWPWKLGELTGLAMGGRGDAIGPALQQIQADPNTGPLTCLTAAKLLSMANAAPAAAEFVKLGQQRLSADAFVAEMKPILAADTRLGKSMLRLADHLRTLSPGELHDLDSLVDDGQRESFGAFLRSFRSSTDDQSMAIFLKQAWDLGIGSQIQKELQKLSIP